MNLIYLDLAPAYIPFLVQATKGDGSKIDPTVDNLIIYEEGGADATFDSITITGSPFDPAKVNTKTGLWGVMVAKSALTAGKWYVALWEMTVDGITTAKVEKYFACNSSQFKADVSGLALDSTVAPVLNAVAALQADLGDPSADATTIYAKIQALQAAVAAIPTSPVNVINTYNVHTQAINAKMGKTIQIVRGKAISWTVTLNKDLTGKKVYFTVKDSLSDTATPIIDKEITNIIDVAIGKIQIDVTKAETATVTVPAGGTAKFYSAYETQAIGGDPYEDLRHGVDIIERIRET